MENQQVEWKKIKEYIENEYKKYVKPSHNTSHKPNYTPTEDDNEVDFRQLNYTFTYKDFLEV